MVLSPLKALLGAQTLLSIASLSNAQQYVGATINTGLPAVPGSEITYFNIKDANSKNTSLINYMSLNSKSQRPDPKLLKRAIIVIHGLNRDPGTYMSNMLSALSQVTGHSDVNADSVAIVAPYFTNGDDKGVGYPWDTTKGGSYTSVLVWKGSQWASGANNQYPKTQTTVSSYAVLDQLAQYFDNKTTFPNINQIVIAGHSLGAQTVQRYCEVGTNLGTKTPIVYWIGNPNSYGWMSTDRPVDYSSCSTYDDWRDGLNSYTNTYGSALVASGRSNVLANYNTKSIAYARGTLDLGDDSSGCEPATTGAERNERFFNFIKAFPPTSSCTIDYVQMGHDAGGMFAAPAGQARLFLDNFDGSGSKAYDYGYPRRQAGDDPYPDPSQSSTIAAVNPGTFNGMTYQGCYADQSPSSLALKAYSSDSNTIDLCTQTCAGKGYTIAGIEYGSECWCGNSMNYRARKTTDQGCTMTCSGNSSQSCGSSYRLSVFSSGTVTIDTKPVSPAQVGSFSLLGCYSEAKSGRALSDKSTSQSGMTVENCALYCSGYNYFGVEYGVECYCGNTVACSSVSSLTANCSMTCGGNSTEYCGNGGYLNMYALPSNTGPSVCPSSTSTSSTATSSTVSVSTTTTGSATTTVSASSTTSATASSTTLACPTANGTTYTTKNSKSYLIECYTDHYAGDMLTTSASTLELCIDACDANAGCVDVAWVYSSCYLKSSVGAAIANNGVLGAKLITSATSTSSSSSTSGSATSSSTTGSSASSSASSSSTTGSSSVSSSSTSSSSTSSAPTASASAISCPASDGTTSIASSGQSFLIECGIDHAGGDMGGPSYPGSFAACVAQCDSTTGCVDVSYVNNGPCYLKKTLGSSVTNAGIWGAKLVTSTSSSSMLTSSSVASSSSTVTSSSSSSAVSSSASSMSTRASSSSVAASSSTTPATSSTTPASSSSSPASSSTPAVSSTTLASSSTTPASSSTSSSTSSTTTATLPTGIIAKGCYVDGSTRVFPTQIYSNSSNTPSLCASACRNKGYKYAGTEYGSECWCGPSLPATTGSTSDCSSSCSGDVTQKCGGSYRLTVTEDTTWKPTLFARASYATWNLMSCYQDQVNNKRTLATGVAIDASTATIAKCLDACYAKGLTYCGAEYYHECYGSSTQPADSLVVPDVSDPLLAGCNYPCSGNSTESCGGSNRILVYINNGTVTST